MFQIHEIVIHPTAGACKIQDIRLEKFSGKPERYYVLTPLNDTLKSKIFVPVAGDKVALRKPVSKAQIDAILDHVHRLPSLWVADAAQRAAAFDEILKAQDHERTLKMIGELIEHRQKALRERKNRVKATNGCCRKQKKGCRASFPTRLASMRRQRSVTLWNVWAEPLLSVG